MLCMRWGNSHSFRCLAAVTLAGVGDYARIELGGCLCQYAIVPVVTEGMLGNMTSRDLFVAFGAPCDKVIAAARRTCWLNLVFFYWFSWDAFLQLLVTAVPHEVESVGAPAQILVSEVESALTCISVMGRHEFSGVEQFQQHRMKLMCRPGRIGVRALRAVVGKFYPGFFTPAFHILPEMVCTVW